MPTSSLGRCSAHDLRVNFFGSGAAAGTGLTGIGIANTSRTPCWLEGVPSVGFFGHTKSGRLTRLTVSLRPSVLFPRHPARIILRHEQRIRSTLARYPAISAGFIITSRDFANGTNPPSACKTVTSISVRLPGLSETDELSMTSLASGVPMTYRICNIPPPVSVSAIVTRPIMLEQVDDLFEGH
ncbi:MAG: DUF4232 domain-containing protein [Acidimicrobiales bacterium]